MVLTSAADHATRYFFPIGRIFSTFFETHGTIERNDCKRPLTYMEGAGDRHTVGHFTPLVTHELHPANIKQAAAYADVRSLSFGHNSSRALRCSLAQLSW